MCDGAFPAEWPHDLREALKTAYKTPLLECLVNRGVLTGNALTQPIDPSMIA